MEGIKKEMEANPDLWSIPNYNDVVTRAADLGKLEIVELLISPEKVRGLEMAALAAEFAGHQEMYDMLVQSGKLDTYMLQMYGYKLRDRGEEHDEKPVTEDNREVRGSS